MIESDGVFWKFVEKLSQKAAERGLT